LDPKTLLIGENLNLKGLSDRWGYPRTTGGITTTSQIPLAGDSYRIYELESAALDFGTPEVLNASRVVLDRERTMEPNRYADGNYLLAIMQNDGRTVKSTHLITENTRNTITIGEDFGIIPQDETIFEIRPLGTAIGPNQRVQLYGVPFNVRIKNLRNNDEIYFNGVEALDVVTIDMSTRRITANRTAGIYDR
jgi:hypothetical protein